MQEKTTRLEQITTQTVLCINSKKTKVMKILTRNMEMIKLSSANVEEVQQFTDPENPLLYAKICLLYRPSYSRFCPKFHCHGNGGWSE